jgi:hypothetical protein
LANVSEAETKVGDVDVIVIVTKDSMVTVPVVVVAVVASVAVAVVACVLATENGQQSSLPLTHPTTPI